MKICKPLAGSAIFLTLTGSTAAFADVTAQQVWADWNDYMNGFGYHVSAQESTSGDTLTIKDFSASMTLPEDGGDMKMRLPTLQFRNRGDGTVSVRMPQHNPVVINVTPKDGDPTKIALDYFQTGLSMIVSGTPDEMTYATTATEIGLKLTGLTAGGQKVSVDGTGNNSLSASLTAGNFLGNYVARIGDLRQMDSTSSIGSVSYELSGIDPSGNGVFNFKGSLEDLKSTSTGAFPAGVDFNNMAAVLNAGFAIAGDFAYGAGHSIFDVKDGSKTTSGTTASQGGGLTFAIDKTQLHYGASSNQAEISITSSDIPFPSLTLKMAEVAADLAIPVAKSDAPQDFSFLIKLRDFALPDELWGMADPTGVLPHDPATLVLDLSGKANWLVDIFDPKQQAQMGDKAPGKIESLTLKDLQARAAGADLTGTGSFTFDNNDLQSFGGMPKPTGAIDLKLVGGNTLLDNLVKMGLMPEDQATGMRMMTGMFAKPGDGDDTLVSKVEITEDGQILANGQRLK